MLRTILQVFGAFGLASVIFMAGLVIGACWCRPFTPHEQERERQLETLETMYQL